MLDKDQILAIERPQTHCAECNGLIEELDRHPTRLTLSEVEPKRRDYCPDCWQFIKNEAFDVYWMTRRLKKEKVIPKLSRREKAVAARALFESLWDQRDREDVEADLYFLAHLLMKWGGLKWKREEKDGDGHDIIVFENPSTGDSIEVRSVHLSEEALEQTKSRLENFLRDYAPENEVQL